MTDATRPAERTGAVAGIPRKAILEQMERILQSAEFRRSERNSGFLRFVVIETLEGRGASLTGHRLGKEVYGRDDFDPSLDPIVRNQASRLRRALERYYFLAGRHDPVVIDLPKGGYAPTFSLAAADADRREIRLIEHTAFEVPAGPSIAVLPFTNLGEDPDQEFFASGLVEELIIELSRFHDFLVIGRQSTLRYSNAAVDLREVGRDLGVRYVLTGSVMKSQLRVRVSFKLTDTQTGGLVWAERIEGDLSVPDVFDLHDRLCSEVVSRVADNYGVIPRVLTKASRRKRTGELSVYEAVLRFHHYVASASGEFFEETRNALEQAVQRDPEYAPAWAKLSETLSDAYMFCFSDEPDLLDRAMDFAKRAVILDHESQDAYAALAWCHYQRRERRELLTAAAKAIELNPNAAYQVGFVGWTIALAGEWDQGLALIDKAMRLNPYNPSWLLLPQYAKHLLFNEYEEALETAHKFDPPNGLKCLLAKAAALGNLGRAAEARQTIAHLLEQHPSVENNVATIVRRIMFLEEIADLMLTGYQKAGFTPGDL